MPRRQTLEDDVEFLLGLFDARGGFRHAHHVERCIRLLNGLLIRLDTPPTASVAIVVNRQRVVIPLGEHAPAERLRRAALAVISKAEAWRG